MANEPATGVVFRSVLGPFEMAERLREKMPDFEWRLGDSEYYRYYYVYGKRADGLKIVIAPEEEADEHHLGVYFEDPSAFPEMGDKLAIARQMHAKVLSGLGVTLNAQ